MAFDPEYVSQVLREHFEDAKAEFLSSLVAIHYAHLVMLRDRDLVGADDARALRDALDAISQTDVVDAPFDESCEDLFFYVERLIASGCGADVAGRLRIARSRNDIDMAMYRMRQRECLTALVGAVLELRGVMVDLAHTHRDTIVAAHTHTQPAQPTTIAHYLLAAIEQLERDTTRLRAAFASTNRSPLGSCAITGTGFPIDRGLTSALLGFDGPTGNTYGSIATVDYLLEALSAVSVLLVGLGRVVQDLLLWCTPAFGYVRLADGLVQGSSIMPQKRNPVALEHARAIASKAIGQAAAVVTTVHNIPFGDVVDTEDDLQPLVLATFHDARRAVTLMSVSLRSAAFDVERLAARATEGGTTLTELADSLVREKAMSFIAAHAVAARYAGIRAEQPELAPTRALADASAAVTGFPVAYSDADIARIMSARHFVEVRRTLGGPAPSVVDGAIRESRELLAGDRAWLERTVAALRAADAHRRQRSAAL